MKRRLKIIITLCFTILTLKCFLFESQATSEEIKEYEYQYLIQEIQENITTLENQIKSLSRSDAKEDIALCLQLEEKLAEEKERLEEEQKKHDMTYEEIEEYEYQKKVQELVQSISNLRSKINSLSRSDRREDEVLRLKLEKQLKEKEKELKYIEEKHLLSELDKIPTKPTDKEETPDDDPVIKEDDSDNNKTDDKNDSSDDKNDNNTSSGNHNTSNRPSSNKPSSSESSNSNSSNKTMAELHVSGREEFEASYQNNYKYNKDKGYYYSDNYHNSSAYYEQMKAYREKYTEPYATNFDSLTDYAVTGLEISNWKLPNNVGKMAYNYTRGIVSSEKGILTTTAFPFSSKWCQSNGQWTFQYTNGAYPKGQTVFNANGLAATVYDWEFIDGKWYPFNEYSWLETGWVYDEAEQAWFYIDKTYGALSGWQEISGKWYYFEPISNGCKGRMLTNTYIGNYYVDENGVWVQ